MKIQNNLLSNTLLMVMLSRTWAIGHFLVILLGQFPSLLSIIISCMHWIYTLSLSQCVSPTRNEWENAYIRYMRYLLICYKQIKRMVLPFDLVSTTEILMREREREFRIRSFRHSNVIWLLQLMQNLTCFAY